MSGHSKWANIKHRKEAQDKKKTKVFNRLMRDLMSAARLDPDPLSPRLATVIEKARAANMPRGNVDRAIKRAQGQGDEGALESVLYEFVGPHNTGIVAAAATDNKNRTVAELRHLAQVAGGAMAAANAVRWQFNERGLIEIDFSEPVSEALELKIIEAGAEDFIEPATGDTRGVVVTSHANLGAVSAVLKNMGLNVADAYLGWVPKEHRSLTESDLETAQKFVATLLEHPDIIRVATTFVFNS